MSATGAVQASSIAPEAFNNQLPQPDDPDKSDDLLYDLHHMAACDTQPFDAALATMTASDRDAALLAKSRDNVQLLFNRLFQLEG